MDRRTFANLDDAELATFQGELTAYIGPDEAARPSWLRRATLEADGTWSAQFRRPVVATSDLRVNGRADYTMTPWCYPGHHVATPPLPSSPISQGMLADVSYIPLALGAAALREAAAAESEVTRRLRLLEDASAAEKERLAREAIDQQRSLQRERDYRARRPERWRALPREAKACFVVAASASVVHGAAGFLAMGRLLADGTDAGLVDPPRTFEPDPERA